MQPVDLQHFDGSQGEGLQQSERSQLAEADNLISENIKVDFSLFGYFQHNFAISS